MKPTIYFSDTISSPVVPFLFENKTGYLYYAITMSKLQKPP